MLTDILHTIILLLFITFGFKRPVIALSGVIWIDIYKPQTSSYSFLSGAQLSFYMTLFFFLVLMLNFRSIKVPKNPLFHLLILGFMGWITVTTIYSQYPDIAWWKHDIAFKTMLFAYFIPFVLKDKQSIDLFIWILIASFGSFIFTGGAKTFMGGGGYGINLTGVYMWSEGSMLSTKAIALLPILWYALKNTKLAQTNKFIRVILYGLSFCSLLCLIGTQARTGLVCLFVLIIWLAFKKRKIIQTTVVSILAGGVLLFFAPDSFYERMATMSSQETAGQESSAHGRVVVWRWTLDYVSEKPILGGGFYAYRDNAGQLAKYSNDSEVLIDTPHPKAFHSIIFEVLGGHGYVGLFIFMSILVHGYLVNSRIVKTDEKKKTLAEMINLSMLIYCAGGLFINVAFYPWIYYMYSLTIALSNTIEKGKANA